MASLAASAITLLVAILAAYLYIQTENKSVISTVSCSGTVSEKRICVMENVCYSYKKNHHTFMLYGLRPLYTGAVSYLMAVDKFPQAAVYFDGSPDMFPAESIIDQPVYAIIRFKPDNLMHVIHDDILPLYSTLDDLELRPPFNLHLMFVDDYGKMPYDTLYQNLTLLPIIYNSVQTRCFNKVILGSYRSTLWYQYGFHSSQGPLNDIDVVTVRGHILSYRQYTEPSAAKLEPNKIVLFTRSETRLILNEDELLTYLSKKFMRSAVSVSLETHTVEEIAWILSETRLLVGMHGSAMAMAMYLPKDSAMLELFPYAVPPAGYTPYKRLADILGVNYLSWQNKHRDRSVGHADFPAEFGGLDHISAEERQRIVAETEVPPHHCCDDPSWLYHIYQDTWVTIPEINELLDELIL